MLNTENIDLSGTNIVIVEDDKFTIAYYQAIFENTNAEITVCKTGQQFVDYINSSPKKIDIVIMDYLIPAINGIDCTRIFRKTNKKTPVVMLSAYFTEQTKTEAYLAGCNEYILKPIYPKKIYYLIEYYVRNKCTVVC